MRRLTIRGSVNGIQSLQPVHLLRDLCCAGLVQRFVPVPGEDSGELEPEHVCSGICIVVDLCICRRTALQKFFALCKATILRILCFCEGLWPRWTRLPSSRTKAGNANLAHAMDTQDGMAKWQNTANSAGNIGRWCTGTRHGIVLEHHEGTIQMPEVPVRDPSPKRRPKRKRSRRKTRTRTKARKTCPIRHSRLLHQLWPHRPGQANHQCRHSLHWQVSPMLRHNRSIRPIRN